MSLALTEDHVALAEVVRSFLADQNAHALARTVVDGRADADLETIWRQMAGLGWFGLHLPTEFGGDGYGLPEVAIVAEQLGREVVPVPFLASVVASALIAEFADEQDRRRLLPGFVDGTHLAGLGLAGTLAISDGVLNGDAGYVVGARVAGLLALCAGDDVVLVSTAATGVTVEPVAALDPGLHIGRVGCAEVAPEAVLPGAAAAARKLAQALGAADAAGGAQATLDMAVEYAKVRRQFGRIIGSFQAIKHHCANMVVAAELAVATAWDAARAGALDEQGRLAASVAGALAYDAYIENAQQNLQIHGGIGFTWEHDCHLYLRRAQSLRALFGATETAHDDVLAAAQAGVRRQYAVDLPEEAEQFRSQARQFVAEYHQAAESDRRSLLVESGYLVPHWPKPFGRAASPVEQLVIEEEFGELKVPALGIGGWVLLTITQHGSPEQIERWVRPSLLGELVWCQLFSEPGAGSDAAAVSTKAVRVEGGWRVTGQKVWTSNAHLCNRGLATIRTNRDVPKHRGITTMAVDLTAPGVTIRPLRQISGDSSFNEVFFDDVFVPDEDVVGAVDDGWTVARATLGNERISIGGTRFGPTAFDLLPVLAAYGANDRAATRAAAGLLATEQAMRLLNLRQVARAVAGSGPGPEGNVTKLLSSEHVQHIGELGMRIAGEAGVVGEIPQLAYGYLVTRAMTIAGGTSEINRNVIAERLLGLPRERIEN